MTETTSLLCPDGQEVAFLKPLIDGKNRVVQSKSNQANKLSKQILPSLKAYWLGRDHLNARPLAFRLSSRGPSLRLEVTEILGRP